MDPSNGFPVLLEGAARLPAVLLSASLRASIIFAIVCALALWMRRAHPRLRSLLWLCAIASYPVVLAVSLGQPLLFFEVGNPFRQEGLRGAFSAIVEPRQAAFPLSGLLAATPAPPGAFVADPGLRNSMTGSFAAVGWSMAAAAVWAAGALLSYLRVLLGRLELRKLLRKARPEEGQILDLVARLRDEMGIRRAISIVTGDRCSMPFTWRLARPIIMLPASIDEWPMSRLRSVLLHELRHVARHDQLTRAAARIVCSLFWFVPFIWLAYEFLTVEQEKACDREAIERGAEPRQYASCVLEFARASRSPALFESVSLAGQRKRVLESRIRSIVAGGKTMKKNVLVFVAAVVIVAGLIVLSAAASREKLTAEAAWAKLVGTWVNMEYAGAQPYAQMLVLKPGFTGEDWLHPTDPNPDGTWRVKPKKVWTDREGNTFLQFFSSYTEPKTPCGIPTGTGRMLIRMDRNGQTLELTATFGQEEGAYPVKIDPNAKIEYFSVYFIYHREQ
jgi:beta-lactamase regulating signal transducer with metallopeptidase domain